MWKEFYKDGKVYTKETTGWSDNSFETTKEESFLKNGYTLVFDRRELSYINCKSGTLVLENDVSISKRMEWLQNEFDSHALTKKHVSEQITCLHPSHVKHIKKLLDDKLVKNILIDSMFQDKDQFRFLINNLFCHYTDLNFFILSHGHLEKLVSEEIKNNMRKYKVRNSYYKNFNDLTFTLHKNNIYELNFDGDVLDYITRLELMDMQSDEIRFSETTKYKFMVGKYDTDDSDITPSDSKSVWK